MRGLTSFMQRRLSPNFSLLARTQSRQLACSSRNLRILQIGTSSSLAISKKLNPRPAFNAPSRLLENQARASALHLLYSAQLGSKSASNNARSRMAESRCRSWVSFGNADNELARITRSSSSSVSEISVNKSLSTCKIVLTRLEKMC